MKVLNASPGFGSPMTEDQVKHFLSASKLNLILGTMDEKGDPNLHPTWYYYDKNKIYVETSKISKKVQNMKRKSIVYFCIDDETIPYKGVRGKGKVRISEDVMSNIPIAEKIMIKYTGSLDNKVAKFLMNAVNDGFSVILEITPIYYSTWDYSMMDI